jgi:serine/threonine protein kinase
MVKYLGAFFPTGEECCVETQNGLVADRYRLVRLVGRGGMGAVWEGWDDRLQRAVALKVLHAQQRLPPAVATELAERAMREARLVARLQHRYAVPIYDVTEFEGQPCLVMQFVPSQTLADVLGELNTLDEHEAATLGAQVASALAAAHAAGIVHRDVKPANILVADDGTARISDFGIAHAFGETTLTSTGMLTGTPAYLAPEVARGEESSYASDVFSLGSTLYATLEGRPPFGDQPNAIGLLHRVASGAFDPPRQSGALTPLLTRMMSVDPRDRPTMAQVADDLDRFRVADRMPPPGSGAPRPAGVRSTDELVLAKPGEEATSPLRRRRTLLAAVVLLVALALVAAVVTLLRPGSSDPATAPPPSKSPTSSASPTPSDSSAATSPDPRLTAEAPAPAPAPSPSALSPTPPGAAPSTTAAPPPAPSVPPSARPTAGPVSRPPTPQQLAAAISGYYALVPRQLDQAWPLMTADYQTRVAGGRAAYGRFWAGFSAVSATEVTGSPPGTATALITYTTTGGQVIRERTTFGLVDEGGVLKIASSTVTSRSG